MNTNITALKNEMTKINEQMQRVQSAIQKEFNEVFAKDTDIAKEVSRLENSDRYDWNEFGEIAQLSNIESPILQRYDTCLAELFNYLQDEHNIDLHVKSHSLSTAIRDCLVINEKGDVYNQSTGKVVIEAKAYVTENGYDNNKLVDLLEIYQQVNGTFLPVMVVHSSGAVSLFKQKKFTDEHNEQIKNGRSLGGIR